MWTDWICPETRRLRKLERADCAPSLCPDGTELVPCDIASRCYCRETTLEEILSDPIVRDLMQADGVDAVEMEAMLRRIAGRPTVAAPP